MTTALLGKLILFELGAVLIAVAALFGHALTLKRVDKKRTRAIERAMHMLTDISDGGLSDASPDFLTALPVATQMEVFVSVQRNLSGEARRRMGSLARGTGLLERAERLCSSRWWWRRLRGVRLYTLIGGGDAIVPSLLSDPVPEVRAQAAHWSSEHPSDEIAAKLVGLLGDTHAFPRFTVKNSLLRMGSAAAPRVLSVLEEAPSEATLDRIASALDVAAVIAEPRFLEAGLSLSRCDDAGIRARACGLLGRLGGNDATNVLLELSGDRVPAVRAEAARGIGRLGHWPSAPQIAALLRDESWDVRRSAGLTLLDLGSPGKLLLRRMKDDRDPFAADMARQVLDLPGRIAA